MKVSGGAIYHANILGVTANQHHAQSHDHSLAADGSPIAVAGVPSLPASKITSERFTLDRLPDGTSGLVLTAQGSGVSPAYTAKASFNLWGNGSDGNVTIATSVSLSRDMFYNNLTINAGVSLRTNGYRLFVAGTLTNNGIIHHDGDNGATGSAGNGAAAGVLRGGGNGGAAGYAYSGGGGGGGGVVLIVAKTINNAAGIIRANGGSGGNGSTTASANAAGSAASNVTYTLGKAGGSGGTCGSYAGGAGGSVSSPNLQPDNPVLTVIAYDWRNSVFWGGGAGGGGGASQVNGTQNGGGGGGGAGCIIIFYNTATWGTEQANGGSGGTGANGGGNGVAGTNGSVLKYQLL
jgi:hypothetical protein